MSPTLARYVLASLALYALLGIVTQIGLEWMNFEPSFFIPVWMGIYYVIDFWINRSWVFRTQMSSGLLLRTVVYQLTNWAVTSWLIVSALGTIELGGMWAVAVVILLTPVRFLAQKWLVYR
jgi:putative flippase GtrA